MMLLINPHHKKLSCIFLFLVSILLVSCKTIPEIVEFNKTPTCEICSGNEVVLKYKFHVLNEDGDLIDPSSSDRPILKMMNETDDVAISGELINSKRVSKGVYVNKNPIRVRLDKSARIGLTIAADESDYRALVVPVIENNYGSNVFGYNPGVGPYVWRCLLSSNSLDSLIENISSNNIKSRNISDPSPPMPIPIDIFGEEVLVDHLENLHPFDIEVIFSGITGLLPANGSCDDHMNLKANGTWTIRIENELYEQFLEDHTVVFVKIFLKCTL